MDIGVYIIRHSSGYYYIGQSTGYTKRRLNHLSLLNRGCHPAKNLQLAYNNDNNLSWEFIPTTDQLEAIALESYYLLKYKGDPLLTNNHGNNYIPQGVIFQTGVKQTKERIEHRAAIMRDLERSDEWKRNISIGRKNSPKAKECLELLQKRNQKPVSIDGVIYPSAKIAADTLGIHTATMNQRLHSTSERFSSWYYQ